MSTASYVTDKGATHVDASLPREVGWWRAATDHGLALARWTEPGQPPRYLVQDRCYFGERESCGLGARVMDALRWENAYQQWVDDPTTSWGYAHIVGRKAVAQ